MVSWSLEIQKCLHIVKCTGEKYIYILYVAKYANYHM